MKKRIPGFAWLAFFGTVLVFSVQGASALDYPTKPVRIIVPFAAGGPNDIRARLVAEKLSESLKQQVFVDNKPGADGAIGMELAAKSAPDGYTLILGTTGSTTVTPSIYEKLRYDPVKDFAPITQLTTSPLILLVNPSVPARSVKELIALAKAKPGQLSYASASSPFYLVSEMFKLNAGVDIAYIPYKGAAPAMTALISNEVGMMFCDTSPLALSHVKAGKARALAICNAQRSSAMPELPTMSESGLPGFEASIFSAILAPARTPKEIINRLHAEIVKILRVPEIAARLTGVGDQIVGSTPAELSAHIKTELERYAKVIKASHIPRIK